MGGTHDELLWPSLGLAREAAAAHGAIPAPAELMQPRASLPEGMSTGPTAPTSAATWQSKEVMDAAGMAAAAATAAATAATIAASGLRGLGSAHGGGGTPRGYAERVIRAPQNSSWADVLRIEAAEKQLAEAQLALRNLRAASQSAEATALARLGEHAPATPNEAVAPYHAGHAASATATHHVFEQTPLEEEDLDAAEYDA